MVLVAIYGKDATRARRTFRQQAIIDKLTSVLSSVR